MPPELSPIDKAKFVAAKRAVEFIESGMRVGLGTGSTAAWMVRCLAERIRLEGIKVQGVPTSTRTAELAHQLGIPILSLDEAKWLFSCWQGLSFFLCECGCLQRLRIPRLRFDQRF